VRVGYGPRRGSASRLDVTDQLSSVPPTNRAGGADQHAQARRRVAGERAGPIRAGAWELEVVDDGRGVAAAGSQRGRGFHRHERACGVVRRRPTDGVWLSQHAEHFRIEFNTIRPHESAGLERAHRRRPRPCRPHHPSPTAHRGGALALFADSAEVEDSRHRR